MLQGGNDNVDLNGLFFEFEWFLEFEWLISNLKKKEIRNVSVPRYIDTTRYQWQTRSLFSHNSNWILIKVLFYDLIILGMQNRLAVCTLTASDLKIQSASYRSTVWLFK